MANLVCSPIHNHIPPRVGNPTRESQFTWVGITALLAGLAFFTLPESPLFPLSHNGNGPQALDTLCRITGTQTLTGIARGKNTATKKTTSAVHGLFGDGRLLMTLLFWLSTGTLLMGFYFLVNWTSTLLVRCGFSAKTAALGSVLLNVGGAVLGLGVGQFSDRWGGRRVMSAIFVAGGLSLALAGAASGSAPDGHDRVGRYCLDRRPGCDGHAGSAKLPR